MDIVLVSIDSLRTDFLSCYSDRPLVVDYPVHTPNLDRFAERATVFDSHYAGSLPCMPARREWLTGHQEFLWRPWGPIEPFDQPLARLARQHDVFTGLVTDHLHYFRHGSDGYHKDFNSYEYVRGHERDNWRPAPATPDQTLLQQLGASDARSKGYPSMLFEDEEATVSNSKRFLNWAQYARNVSSFEVEEDFFPAKVFNAARGWLAETEEWSSRFLYVDSFDVHEPFHCPAPYARMYTEEDPYDPELLIAPRYGRIDEGQSELSTKQLEFVIAQYAGKVSMVDRWLGELFDELDSQGAWDRTMVVVTSDHGYSLGDGGWVGKNYFPVYDTIANTPLMIWHPRNAHQGEHTGALTAAVDLYSTLLDAMGLEAPDGTHGRSLLPLLTGDRDHHREWAIYGHWGSSICVTDGEFTYHHPTDRDGPLYSYSTRMSNPRGWFKPPEVQPEAEADRYIPGVDVPVWRYPAEPFQQHEEPLLFDRHTDPQQRENLVGERPSVHERLRHLLVEAMESLSAPREQFERLDLASQGF